MIVYRVCMYVCRGADLGCSYHRLEGCGSREGLQRETGSDEARSAREGHHASWKAALRPRACKRLATVARIFPRDDAEKGAESLDCFVSYHSDIECSAANPSMYGKILDKSASNTGHLNSVQNETFVLS